MVGEDILSGEVGDVDEGVVEGGKDVADAEDVLALGHLRTQADHLLLLLLLPFTRSHLLLRRKRSQTHVSMMRSQ